ncbi:site-specific integrase [Segatella albensis]|uniref:site-specific integrase n=1 Tax=Segatella albensis TaxID=77768 RepID=UPI0003FCEDA2|nr:site-specific integrase [Segatella albensis]
MIYIRNISYRNAIIKQPVKLRYKTLKKNNKSLYLDIYLNGIRKYEFLRLYLVPEVDENCKKHNQQVLRQALNIQAQRMMEIYGGVPMKPHEKPHLPVKLSDFIQQYAESYRNAGHRDMSRYQTILTLIPHLEIFGAKDLPLCEIDKDFCLQFIQYLETAKDLRPNIKEERQISSGTAYLKYSIFRTVIKEAHRQGLIKENPILKLQSSQLPHRPDSTRCYLTKKELKKLINTPCDYSKLKEAFMFSCFTGLRKSDVLELKWCNVLYENRKWIIRKKIKKTQRWLTIPLSEEAREWLPKHREKRDSYVFPQMPSTSLSINVKRWAKKAGIKNKIVTFHVARHTFATLELSLGVDLYTVSKLLGHRSITTTQTYTKVIDKKKENAMNRIDKAFRK